MPTDYLNASDISRELGITRQAVAYRLAVGSLPRPDGYLGARRAPIWRRRTLERAGVLQAAPAGGKIEK